jgi:hypothetical protein
MSSIIDCAGDLVKAGCCFPLLGFGVYNHFTDNEPVKPTKKDKLLGSLILISSPIFMIGGLVISIPLYIVGYVILPFELTYKKYHNKHS